MDEGTCIRIWTRGTVPDRFHHLSVLYDHEGVEFTAFVAHIPAAMLADRTYRACNGESGIDGWLRDGELGLFGTNSLDEIPHPDGDGILVVGCWI